MPEGIRSSRMALWLCCDGLHWRLGSGLVENEVAMVLAAIEML